MTKTINPIRLEIIRNALISAAEEMGVAVRRTARSVTVREMRDFSTAIFDAQGRNIAQAARIPVHLNTMSPCLQEVLENHLPAGDWEEGDVVVINDPYCGGQHLPDVIVYRPIFVDGALMGFSGVIAHQADIGGGSPGSYNMKATEIFAEGLIIPPVKIRRRGVIVDDIIQIIKRNVRQPDLLHDDLLSLIASTDIGAKNIMRLADKFGADVVQAATEMIIDQSAAAMAKAIAELPDGRFEFADVIDDDGIEDRQHTVRVAVIIENGKLTIDFTGTDPQAKGLVNCTLNITKSCIYYAVMAAIGDHIPPNSGCYSQINIVAPLGTLVNCAYPAPVVGRIVVGHRVANVIMGALSKAMPDRIPAAYYGVSYVMTTAIGTGARTKVYLDTEVGGWGGEPGKDGANAFSAGLHNLSAIPIEMLEAVYPIRFRTYGLRPDSGGAGTYRGGLGLIREWRLEADSALFACAFDRTRSQPFGLHGGEPGSCTRVALVRGDGELVELGGKVVGVPVARGEGIRVETAGGGGFGPRAERTEELLSFDRREGYVTQ